MESLPEYRFLNPTSTDLPEDKRPLLDKWAIGIGERGPWYAWEKHGPHRFHASSLTMLFVQIEQVSEHANGH